MEKKFDKKKLRITPQQLMFLNNQLASMVRLDLSIPLGFQSLAREVKDSAFKYLIEEVERDLSQGVPLMESLQKFPSSFPPLYLQILKAGETTGNLATVLYQLSKYSETMYRVKNRIRDAVSYPMFILLASGVLLLYMLLSAVPQFKSLFDASQAKNYPVITKVVFFLSDFALTPSYSIPFSIVLLGVVAFIFLKIRSAIEGASEVIFHFPLFGTLFKKAAFLKICRTMADLLKNGVSMVETLGLPSDIAGKNKIKEALVDMKGAVENGERMSSKLQEKKIFPETMIWKLQMAEERGILEEALEELAFQYEEELEAAASRVMRIIEPVMLMFIAIMIGTLVLALYLPLFQASSGVAR